MCARVIYQNAPHQLRGDTEEPRAVLPLRVLLINQFEVSPDTTFTIARITINGALIGGIILPGILVIAALVWPYLDKSPVRAVGVWLATERRKQNLIFLIIVAGILILTIIGTFMRGPYWNWYWPWQSWPTMPRKF